jgi:hypothetical protein
MCHWIRLIRSPIGVACKTDKTVSAAKASVKSHHPARRPLGVGTIQAVGHVSTKSLNLPVSPSEPFCDSPNLCHFGHGANRSFIKQFTRGRDEELCGILNQQCNAMHVQVLMQNQATLSLTKGVKAAANESESFKALDLCLGMHNSALANTISYASTQRDRTECGTVRYKNQTNSILHARAIRFGRGRP